MIPLPITDATSTSTNAIAAGTPSVLPIRNVAFTDVFALLVAASENSKATEDTALLLVPEGEDPPQDTELPASDSATDEEEVTPTLVIAPPPEPRANAVTTVGTAKAEATLETDVPTTPRVPAAVFDTPQPKPETNEKRPQNSMAQIMVEGRFPAAPPQQGAVTPPTQDLKGRATEQSATPALPTTVKPDQTQIAQPVMVEAPKTISPAALLDDTTKRKEISPRDLAMLDVEPSTLQPAKTPSTASQSLVPLQSMRIAPQPIEPRSAVPDEVELLPSLTAGERAAPVAHQTATAAAPTAGAETARHVANQIAVVISNQPGRPTEIALQPKELGRVRLSMTAVDTTITLNILAERPETTDLLRRHIDALSQEFEALGYDTISFSFGHDTSASDDQSATDGERQSVPATEQVTQDAPPADTKYPASGLDLRL